MNYILYLVILFGSPGNDGVPLVLKSPRVFTTLEACKKEGEAYGFKTDLPIQDAAVYCKPEPQKDTMK